MSAVAWADSYSLAALDICALAVARACSTFLVDWSTLAVCSVVFRLYSKFSLTFSSRIELSYWSWYRATSISWMRTCSGVLNPFFIRPWYCSSLFFDSWRSFFFRPISPFCLVVSAG